MGSPLLYLSQKVRQRAEPKEIKKMYQIYEVLRGDVYELASDNKHIKLAAAIFEMNDIARLMLAKRLRILDETGRVMAYFEDQEE